MDDRYAAELPARIFGRIFTKKDGEADLDMALVEYKDSYFILTLHQGNIIHIIEHSDLGEKLILSIMEGLVDNDFKWQDLDIKTKLYFPIDLIEDKIHEWAFRPFS
jgi:hypothetical protein